MRACRLTRPGVDGARLVEIVAGDLRVFNDFDDRRLARLLVVLDGISYTEVQTTARNGLLEMSEEFGLENTVDQRIRLLRRADS